ncbi:hypothetical protein SNEBB_004741 [Seison nebaliae]|nr:hypothetical protein SNEBB_004741 [Seison nebaliae]
MIWNYVQHGNISVFAVDMMIRFFRKNPEMKTYFAELKTSKKNDTSRRINYLKFHGHQIFHIFRRIVDNIDTMDMNKCYLQEIGNRHICYRAQQSHFPLMREAFLYSLKTNLDKSVYPKKYHKIMKKFFDSVSQWMIMSIESNNIVNKYNLIQQDKNCCPPTFKPKSIQKKFSCPVNIGRITTI